MGICPTYEAMLFIRLGEASRSAIMPSLPCFIAFVSSQLRATHYSVKPN